MISNPENKPSAVGEEPAATAFDRVILPYSRHEFLSNFWCQSWVRVTGHGGRFAALLPWDELNHILEHNRVKSPRLSLFRDGKPVDPARFFSKQNGVERLRPASLANCLSEGATLILDSVHEFAPSVRQITEAFEEVLGARTTANLYAGWRTQMGFKLHWDPQDTMILQVSGRKHWKVYRPTLTHPFIGETEQPPKPVDEPVWDGILEDGDMLYLPRGWWHVAFPLDEPSLHLTVTIVPANGTDLLRWFMDGMKRHAEVRMNVPHPASAEEQRDYVSLMRKLILEQWDDNILDRFLAEWNAIPLRPQLQLPFSPARCLQPITLETSLRLATTGQLSFLTDADNVVSFSANGVWWKCSPDLVPALELLRGDTNHSIRELCGHLSDTTTTPRLMAFLTSLAMGGVVWIEPGQAP